MGCGGVGAGFWVLGFGLCVVCRVLCAVCCGLCDFFSNAFEERHAEDVFQREDFTNMQPKSDNSISVALFFPKPSQNGSKLAPKIEGKSTKNGKKKR